MILVDTSIWVEHFRKGSAELVSLLSDTQVLTHPFVIGELACGNLKSRSQVLALLHDLPAASVAEDREVLALVESRKLMGHGIGWVDAHLLASALLTNSSLWTADKKLRSLCAILNILY